MHDNSVTLHSAYKGVNDPPFLLAGTVLTFDTDVRDAVLR